MPFGNYTEAETTDGSAYQGHRTLPADRPLVLFAFFETELARMNLEFFIKHGLHDAADFMFVLNGETDAEKLIPKRPNIRYIKRGNDCYDMGAFAEVLIKNDLYKNYKRYITLNSSIRGPFLPTWSDACWSETYLNKITDSVKVRRRERCSCTCHNMLTL